MGPPKRFAVLLAVLLVYASVTLLWPLTPWSLWCPDMRGTENYNHHVCIGQYTVSKKMRFFKLREAYTDHQLATTYRTCPTTALATAYFTHAGVSYYRRIDHHDVTPRYADNWAALKALDRCAEAAGDCFDDLMPKNIHLDAEGRVVIIDTSITPCWALPDGKTARGMTNLIGSTLERFYAPPRV